jgi:acetyl esterase/lipase
MTRVLLALAVGLAVAIPMIEAAPPKADAPAAAEQSVPVKVARDIQYATIDGENLYLDLAVPKAKGNYPCVVMFHGGAWRFGSRRELSSGGRDSAGNPTPSLIERVAARGYVVASVGYRLAPKHKFPAQIRDARASVRFLRADAKKYSIDPDRFAACGFSSGGHLALLLGMANGVEGWDAGGHTDQSSKVQCVVDFFGPTDLSLYAATPALEDAYMVPVFGKVAKTDPDVYKKASPINYVSKESPPALLLHGNFDLIVPIIHSERLQMKLREEKVEVEMITVRGEGHGWGGAALASTTEDTIRFLDKHLKGKK